MTVPSGSNDSCVSESGRSFGVKSKYLAKRRKTVQEIWKALEKYCVVLVRGNPCSGKSTLGYLVARHARKRLKEPYDTVLVPIWYPRLGETATEILRDACAKQLPGRKFGEGIPTEGFVYHRRGADYILESRPLEYPPERMLKQ